MTNLIEKIIQIKKKNKKNNFYENGSELRSDASDASDSDTITGFRMSPNPKSRIYETTQEQYHELKYGKGEDLN